VNNTLKRNEEGDKNMTTKYWIYRGLRGGGFATRMKGIIFDNLEDAQAFVNEKHQQSPNAEFSIITKTYNRRL
jgi:hypothetical protein